MASADPGRTNNDCGPSSCRNKRKEYQMKRNLMKCAVALTVVLSTAFPLFAAGNDGVTVDLKGQKVVKASDGKEKFTSADAAKPGDVIEYKAVYRNSGKIAATDIRADIPIPLGTEYLPGSAKPATFKASLDGKGYAPVPLKRKVTLPSGKTEMQEVPSGEYRFIRWELKSLAPGKSSTFILRVKLST
jgi:uncharacterized repeat protein (TIGR01451 family)